MISIKSLALAALLAPAAVAAGSPAPAGPGAVPDLKGVDVKAQMQALHEKAAAASAERPLFIVKQIEGHYLMSIQQGQLDKPFLLSATVSKGLGERGVYSGAPLANFLVAFRRTGDIVELMRLNSSYRAAPGTPEADAVKASYPDVPLAAVKIVTESVKAGWMVVPAEPLFLSDPADAASEIAGSYGIPAAALKLVAGVTRLASFEAFHANAEAEADYVFEPQVPVRSATLPDSRHIPLSVRYSLSVLPNSQGFDQRPLDPRIGYFTTKYRDYSAPGLKDKMDPLVQLANRWRLEKAVPDAPVSDVKKPIVWWVDPATPAQYRDAVKAGILAWNAAFEAIGLRRAIVVKDPNADMTPEQRAAFNPADASYNVVRWFLAPDAGYAYASERVNPMTGEIVSASVMLSDQMSRLWDVIDKPELASKIDGDARPDAATMTALKAQGLTAAQKAKILRDYISSVVTHEIGHTLGLRHNFKGSEMLDLDHMGQDGNLASTVMDYLPMNVPGKGQPQVYFQMKPGPYDMAAIRYGYAPLPADPAAKAAALREIARQTAADPRLAFGTDEDVRGIDPDAQRFDFSNQPVRYANQLADRADSLWKTGTAVATPEDVPSPRAALYGGVSLYGQAVGSVLPIVGGVRSDRRPADEGGPTLAPVSAVEQRAALDFLAKRVFSAKAFPVPPGLVLRAAPDPLTAASGGALADVGAAELAIQREALGRLYDPATLRRLETAAAVDPKGALKESELFAAVRGSVWSELAGKGRVAVTPARRQLQRADVDELAALAKSASASGDSVALARAELSRIAASAKAAKARATDPVVKAHLSDLARRAKDALDGSGDSKDSTTDDSEDDLAAR